MALLLKNVELEQGYMAESDGVIRTKTEPFDVLIEDGVIKKIEKNILPNECMQTVDTQGQLLLPAFREMHVHLDKTYFGGEWKAPTPITNGIMTRIEEEQTLLPQQLPFLKERARKLIERYIANGHTHIRSHCNVDAAIGVEHIRQLKEVIAEYDDKITFEIVAFPQHGLLRSQVVPHMREALTLGVTHIGGVDPASIDRDIHKSLETTVALAKEFNVAMDLHIHDRDTLGAFEFHVLMDLIEQQQYTNPVTISHAFALAELPNEALEQLTARMASHKIDVTTTIPIGQKMPTIPIDYLMAQGVHVSLGHDSITDHWSPFGTADTIEKLNMLVTRFRYIDEIQIGQSLKYATGGITPLNERGECLWPKVGDPANVLLVDCVSSAHMIARQCPISTVISKGKIVHQANVEQKGAYR